jgi:hypothetical protein
VETLSGCNSGAIVTIALLSPIGLIALLLTLTGLLTMSDGTDLAAEILVTVFFALVAVGAGVGIGLAVRHLRRR